MSEELMRLAADAMPFVTAAAGAYGGAVLTKAHDKAAGPAVDLGRRVLQKIFGKHRPGEVPEALAAVIADPTNNHAALHEAVHEALEANESLATDVRAMLTGVQVGDHANVVANSYIGGNNIQIGNVGGSIHINDERR